MPKRIWDFLDERLLCPGQKPIPSSYRCLGDGLFLTVWRRCSSPSTLPWAWLGEQLLAQRAHCCWSGSLPATSAGKGLGAGLPYNLVGRAGAWGGGGGQWPEERGGVCDIPGAGEAPPATLFSLLFLWLLDPLSDAVSLFPAGETLMKPL